MEHLFQHLVVLGVAVFLEHHLCQLHLLAQHCDDVGEVPEAGADLGIGTLHDEGPLVVGVLHGSELDVGEQVDEGALVGYACSGDGGIPLAGDSGCLVLVVRRHGDGHHLALGS